MLAACLDLRAALARADPEAHLSRVAVHQDGSCNGLQHYAALGRDARGGAAVNLAPADRPQASRSQCVNRQYGGDLVPWDSGRYRVRTI